MKMSRGLTSILLLISLMHCLVLFYFLDLRKGSTTHLPSVGQLEISKQDFGKSIEEKNKTRVFAKVTASIHTLSSNSTPTTILIPDISFSCPALHGISKGMKMFFESCRTQPPGSTKKRATTERRGMNGEYTSTHENGCLRFGTAYGGHEIPHPICWLNPGDVYYGFGCGEDISFDVSLAHSYDLKIRLFDPTPRAANHVHAVFEALKSGKAPSFSPVGRDKFFHEGSVREISGGVSAKSWFETVITSNVSHNTFEFKPWALAVENANMTFFEPQAGVSHSLIKNAEVENSSPAAQELIVTGRRLDSIMAEMGDNKISILKVDIEGYEVVLIPKLVDLFRKWERHLWPRLLLFDMDSMRPNHKQRNIVEAKKCIQLLVNAGYGVFSSEGYDYTFVLENLSSETLG